MVERPVRQDCAGGLDPQPAPIRLSLSARVSVVRTAVRQDHCVDPLIQITDVRFRSVSFSRDKPADPGNQ